MSVFFFKAAIILVASSGKLVHIATIVIQIKLLGRPKDLAINIALSTIKFQPYINQNNHQAINKLAFQKGNVSICSSLLSFGSEEFLAVLKV